MLSRKINLLMRLFFRYDCEVVLLLDKNQLVSIEKNAINILMSDLNNFRKATVLPSEKISSLEQLLQVYAKSGMQLNQKAVIALVNEQIDLIAQLGKEEVIRFWDQLEESKKNTKAEESFKQEITTEKKTLEPPIEEQKKEEHESFASFWQRKKKQQTIAKEDKEFINTKNKEADVKTEREHTKIDTIISIQSKAIREKKQDSIPSQLPQQQPLLNESRKSVQTNVDVSLPKQDFLDQGSLAIITMEALPLPMLACDTLGNELFLNKDWQFFHKQKKEILNKHALLEEAKALMVEKAKEGTLDAQTPLLIETFSAFNASEKKFIRYNVFLKAIRLEKKEGSEKTIGYLFYITPEINNKVAVQDTKEEPISYLGRTLPEILAEEEKKVLRWAFLQAGENQSNAAMLLGIPRQTYSYKFNKYFKKSNNLD